MSDPEGKSLFDGSEKVYGIGRCLGVVDGQMHETRTAIDRDVEEALAGLPIRGLQLRQMLHVDMDVAKVIIPERAITPGRVKLFLWRPAVETCVLQERPDTVSVEVRQEVVHRKGQVIEPEFGRSPQVTDDRALFLRRLLG